MTAPSNKLTTLNVGGTSFSVKSNYTGLKVIGRGSYGVVVSCTEAKSGDKVAIKRIKPMSAHSSDAKHVLREIRCMRLLGAHSNVVSVRDLFCNPREDELYIVMELMDSDLHRIIQSPQALTDAHHRFFMYQLVRGVKYMHEKGIIHRDLKPGNLLVTRNCELRITDFGLARLQSVASEGGVVGDLDAGPMTQHVVTRWYRPPELMLTPDGRYTNAVDMWSVGCILAELLGRRPLFPGKNFVHQLQLIFNVIGSPAEEQVAKVRNKQARKFLDSVKGKPKVAYSKLFAKAVPAATTLLEELLLFEPAQRAKAEPLLAHEYFRSLSYADALPVKDPPADPNCDFAFEQQQLSSSTLKGQILEEVALLSKEAVNPAAPTRGAPVRREPAVVKAKPAASKQHDLYRASDASSSRLDDASTATVPNHTEQRGGFAATGSAAVRHQQQQQQPQRRTSTSSAAAAATAHYQGSASRGQQKQQPAAYADDGDYYDDDDEEDETVVVGEQQRPVSRFANDRRGSRGGTTPSTPPPPPAAVLNAARASSAARRQPVMPQPPYQTSQPRRGYGEDDRRPPAQQPQQQQQQQQQQRRRQEPYNAERRTYPGDPSAACQQQPRPELPRRYSTTTNGASYPRPVRRDAPPPQQPSFGVSGQSTASSTSTRGSSAATARRPSTQEPSSRIKASSAATAAAAAAAKKRPVTVPKSPSFSKMSWQRA